jgi:quercetin dioxygenase-like cupin family protein
MITSWSVKDVIANLPDHVLVEYVEDDVIKYINFNIKTLVEGSLGIALPSPTTKSDSTEQIPGTRGVTSVGQGFEFAPDGIIASHIHPLQGLHDIQVIKGKIRVRREKSGDVDAIPGMTIKILPGEIHSVEALGVESRTVHWKVD